MRTDFSPAQLADPTTADAAAAARACVHCGFCNATCPTYVLRGDELDGPRGRIYLAKAMLEADAAPSEEVVRHVDRCLSCLACETTCPSGVSYRRVIDKARAYIAARWRRPLPDRLIRSALAAVLPHRGRLRAALVLALLGRPLAPLFDKIGPLRPLAAMLRLSGASLRAATGSAPALVAADAPRVLIARGCVEPVMAPQIQAAAARLIARAGRRVVRFEGEGCCGALSHHMGREDEALNMARAAVDRWAKAADEGLEAIVVTASGCGAVIRDYGHMLRGDPAYAEPAARVSALAVDITEWLARTGLPPVAEPKGLTVAYQAACSLQHGLKVKTAPAQLLADAGFTVKTPAEPHLCCGSAGVYNILQPEIAGQLGARKAGRLDALGADVVASGNIGCLVQLGPKISAPAVHIAELLDWATGGPAPAGLDMLRDRNAERGVSPV
jgi:glycolate oxidase iron-sulfur subunit